jgi:type I restriction enzyme S subunit
MTAVEGWKTNRLDEIGSIFSGSTPSTSIHSFWDGDIVWVTPNDLSKLNTPYLHDSAKRITEKGIRGCSSHLLPAGSLVMSSRAPIGYVAIPTVEFCTNQGCKSIKLKDAFHSEFTYYNVLFNIHKIKSLGEGTTFAEISKTALSTIEISFPTAVSEQAKIAEILSTVDLAIEQTETLIAKQQRIKTGLMQDLLTRGIDENGNLRTEQTHKFKDSPLGRIPVEWEEGGFNDYVISEAGIKPGPFGSSLTKDIHVQLGYRIYGQEQVIGGNLDVGDYYITEKKYVEMKAFSVRAGDVLISLVGTIGHVLVIPEQHHPGVINPRLLRFRPNPKLCLSEFLKALLLSQHLKLQLETFATGGTMPVLSAGIIRKLSIVIIGVAEQKRITEVLTRSERSVLSHFERLNKLRSLKSALMQDLLTGKKRVTALLNS